MTLTTTTLSSALAASGKSIVVASASGFSAGMFILIDREVMRVSKAYVSGTTIDLDGRGLDNTAQVAHPASTNVSVGLATDFATPAPGGPVSTYAVQPGLDTTYYSAAGAITFPAAGRNALAIINGTSALAMTLTSPTKDMDGSRVVVASNGKANHTVTYTTTGFGNIGGTADVITFHATMQQAFEFIAANGIWCLIGQVAGAASVAGVGLG